MDMRKRVVARKLRLNTPSKWVIIASFPFVGHTTSMANADISLISFLLFLFSHRQMQIKKRARKWIFFTFRKISLNARHLEALNVLIESGGQAPHLINTFFHPPAVDLMISFGQFYAIRVILSD